MYVARHHAQPEIAEGQTLIDHFPLGAWVVSGEEGLVANHIPFLLDRSRGQYGTLIGHVARANPVWKQLSAARQSVVMFQGPEAYITPGWYPGKEAHGKVVPTWNYSVAHVHGVAQAIENVHWIRDMLVRLTAANEASRPAPWKVTDAPADFIDKMLRAVVGIEIPIASLMAKLKMSQDEDLQDRLGTVEGLVAEGTERAAAVAALVKTTIRSSDPAS